MNPIEIYGPQGEYVAALVERAQSLTDAEVLKLAQDWDATSDAAWDTAQNAARLAGRPAAWDNAWNAIWDATSDAAWDVASDVAAALVVRDLISPDGFTQEHYDILTESWRRIIGPIHPDDDELEVTR
jgi:hypothetical protein